MRRSDYAPRIMGSLHTPPDVEQQTTFSLSSILTESQLILMSSHFFYKCYYPSAREVDHQKGQCLYIGQSFERRDQKAASPRS